MAKVKRLEKTLGPVLDRFLRGLDRAIHKTVAAAVKGASVGKPAKARRKYRKTKKVKAKATKTRGRKRGYKMPKTCRVPGCKEKNKGPRFAFFCEEHVSLPKAMKEKIKAGEPIPRIVKSKKAKVVKAEKAEAAADESESTAASA